MKSEREVAQSCLTLRNPMDRSLPGSYVHGIFQARVLEWGAIAFSESNAMNIKVQVSFQISAFISFRYIPRSGIAGSYGSCVFNFLWILYTIFQRGKTSLQSHWGTVLHTLTSICLSLVFLMMAIQTGMSYHP